VGLESTLWDSHKDIALILWVSMPSPCGVIDGIRKSLISLLDLRPPPFSVSSSLSIRPILSFEAPLPLGAMYVGLDVGSLNSVYYQIALMRPDLLNWLVSLAVASVLCVTM